MRFKNLNLSPAPIESSRRASKDFNFPIFLIHSYHHTIKFEVFSGGFGNIFCRKYLLRLRAATRELKLQQLLNFCLHITQHLSLRCSPKIDTNNCPDALCHSSSQWRRFPSLGPFNGCVYPPYFSELLILGSK